MEAWGLAKPPGALTPQGCSFLPIGLHSGLRSGVIPDTVTAPFFPFRPWALWVALGCLLASCSDSSRSSTAGVPSTMHPVKPVASRSSAAPAELRIGQGAFFSYALPAGWRVGEEGQFAVTLVAPDSRALTLMVGNAGLPLNYPPQQFAYEKLMAIRPERLQMSPPRQVPPLAGFAYAYEFEVAYGIQGAPCRGWVKVNGSPAYDQCILVMTAALAEERQWPSYASWLPKVAEQISATNGGAFGVRGVMAQNLQNSTAYAAAAREYRDWSQRNWQQVTDQRHASEDRRQNQFRENLGAIQTYSNPYDQRVPIELSTQYQYYWVNRQGEILGTNNPGDNPNTGSTAEWVQMPKQRP